MKTRDLRAWFVNDSNWTPGYVAQLSDEAPASVSREGIEKLLDACAVTGDSAYLDVCFDIDNER